MSDDKGQLMEQLRERLKGEEPLSGEEDFHLECGTLMRFLKARDWKLDEAEKLLKGTMVWRRKTNPLQLDCHWCKENPGCHAIRQVGFDEMGRPVVYSCFAQAGVRRNKVEESITHSTYLIENAVRTMKPGVTSWVLVIDCTDMSLSGCNPKLGYGVTQVMSNHYPERLGMVICINHSTMFQGVWKAIKVFLHPNTAAKMQLMRSKKKIQELFESTFSDELSSWLFEEIRLNKMDPPPQTQREFYLPPSDPNAHDPRGCPSYVKEYIAPCGTEAGLAAVPHGHRPHPNVMQYMLGELPDAKPDATPPTENNAKDTHCMATLAAPRVDTNGSGSDFDDECDSLAGIEIEEEFQIPKDADHLQM